MERKLMTPKGQLRWFLDLINLDVASATDRDIFNLLTELREIAYGPWGSYYLTDDDLIKWRERKRQTEEIKKILKGLLEKILSVSKKPKKQMIRPSYGVGPQDSEGEDTGRAGLALGSIIRSRVWEKPIEKWAKDYIVTTSQMEMEILTDGDRVFTYFPRPEEKLVLEFSSLLKQFPLSSIRRCQREDCQKFFLKATKKEKRYCSNRCAWVVASREKRKLQPKEEREKKRDSYYKKFRREHSEREIQRRQRKEG